MGIITTIFTTIVAIFIGLVVIAIFIQSNVDLWNAVKPEIKDWLKGTKVEMWYKNRKNKVKILTDTEYNQMVRTGKIKSNIVME